MALTLPKMYHRANPSNYGPLNNLGRNDPPLSIQVSGFPSVDRNRELVLAIMTKWL